TSGRIFVDLMELALTSPDVLACCGGTLKDWFLFLGSFHSLVVHFPIALVCLVPVLELYAWKRRDTALAEPIRFVLKLALLASLLAPLPGWMLATADGYAGALVESHMLAGILVPVFCAFALIFNRNTLKLFYGLTLVLAVVAVSLAGFL